jgi:hypothetical protein
MKAWTGVLLVTAAFASSADGQEQKGMIEAPLEISPAKAAQLVQLTALRHEIGVESNQGGVIKLEPKRVRKNNPTTVSLRVNIVGTTEGKSLAVVSGRWYSALTAGTQRVLLGRGNEMQKETGEPVEYATKGWRHELWEVVEHFAAAIKASAQTP